MNPCQAIDECVYTTKHSFFCPPEIWDVVRPKFLEKCELKYLAKKKEKKEAIGNGSAGVHKHVPNFIFFFQNTAWKLKVNLFFLWAAGLNQSVSLDVSLFSCR